MYFISTFHACATGDKVLDRFTSQVPKAVPCFDWEYLYHDFQGTTRFYSLYCSTPDEFWREGPWHFLRKAVSGTPKLISQSFFFLVIFENLEFKKKNCVTQILNGTTDCVSLLTVKQWDSNAIQQIFHSFNLEQDHSLKKHHSPR